MKMYHFHRERVSARALRAHLKPATATTENLRIFSGNAAVRAACGDTSSAQKITDEKLRFFIGNGFPRAPFGHT